MWMYNKVNMAPFVSFFYFDQGLFMVHEKIQETSNLKTCEAHQRVSCSPH